MTDTETYLTHKAIAFNVQSFEYCTPHRDASATYEKLVQRFYGPYWKAEGSSSAPCVYRHIHWECTYIVMDQTKGSPGTMRVDFHTRLGDGPMASIEIDVRSNFQCGFLRICEPCKKNPDYTVWLHVTDKDDPGYSNLLGYLLDPFNPYKPITYEIYAAGCEDPPTDRILSELVPGKYVDLARSTMMKPVVVAMRHVKNPSVYVTREVLPGGIYRHTLCVELDDKTLLEFPFKVPANNQNLSKMGRISQRNYFISFRPEDAAGFSPAKRRRTGAAGPGLPIENLTADELNREPPYCRMPVFHISHVIFIDTRRYPEVAYDNPVARFLPGTYYAGGAEFKELVNLSGDFPDEPRVICDDSKPNEFVFKKGGGTFTIKFTDQNVNRFTFAFCHEGKDDLIVPEIPGVQPGLKVSVAMYSYNLWGFVDDGLTQDNFFRVTSPLDNDKSISATDVFGMIPFQYLCKFVHGSPRHAKMDWTSHEFLFDFIEFFYGKFKADLHEVHIRFPRSFPYRALMQQYNCYKHLILGPYVADSEGAADGGGDGGPAKRGRT